MLSHQLTASERVRARLKEEFAKRPHGFKKTVADRLEVANATVTPWAAGERAPDLDDLEALCPLLDLRLGELIAEPGSTMADLNTEEWFVVRTLRAFPESVRRALVAFLRYFAHEEPAAGQSRKMWELWRHLDPRARVAVYGFAVDKSQGMIPPDLEAALFETLSDEAKAAVGKPARTKRRRKRGDDET